MEWACWMEFASPKDLGEEWEACVRSACTDKFWEGTD